MQRFPSEMILDMKRAQRTLIISAEFIGTREAVDTETMGLCAKKKFTEMFLNKGIP